MAQPQSRWVRFKRFLKRNMTPTWAKHFSYQVFSFLVSVAMVIGVANYAITRSYDEKEVDFCGRIYHYGSYRRISYEPKQPGGCAGGD